MKLKLRYNPKNKRLWNRNKFVIVTIVITIIILVIGALAVYRLRQQKTQLQLLESKTSQLTLGKAKVAPETLPPTKEAAAETVLSELQKQHGNKFNIIFFYDGYQNQKDALLDIEVMKQTLDLVEPFKSLKDHIATKTFTTENQKCQVETTTKKNLKCNQDMIESFARLGIERFKLVIVSPLDFVPNARVSRGKNSTISLSTFQGTLTREEFNRRLSQFFIHELGHSLGLRDEYSNDGMLETIFDPEATASASSDKTYRSTTKPNCAPNRETAQDWWSEYIGVFPGVNFFPGCAGSNTSYFPQENTLMSANPTSETFGQVSEDYLRGVISCFFASKEAIIFQTGFESSYSTKFKNCNNFKKEYPNFWEE